MKRKLEPSQDQTARPHKSSTYRDDCFNEEAEEAGEAIGQGLQWRKLELSLAIESKELDALKKVELVHNYLKSAAVEENYDVDQAPNTWDISFSRLVVRLGSWIQSLLISSEDKARDKDNLFQAENSHLCLDCRCWEIFRYCLEESPKLGVSLSLSGNLLRVISYVSRNAVKSLSYVSLYLQDYSRSEEFKLYNTAYDCMKSMFSVHYGALKGNMKLWMAAVGSILELVTKIFADNLGTSEAGSFFIELSCSVFEAFSKFLRVQRWHKNGFRHFVDLFLEPLLHLLGLLDGQSNSSNQIQTQKLVKLIEEIISYSLFHPAHMDGLLNLQAVGKDNSSSRGELRESENVKKSYHTHLFHKLSNIVSQENVLAIGAIGELFRLFIKQVKRQKTDTLKIEDAKHMEGKYTKQTSIGSSGRSVLASENSDNLNSSLRMSIFHFIEHSVDPLLHELKLNIQSDLGVETSPQNVHGILKSINKMLSSIIFEKVYVRTEDISQDAWFNLFKRSFGLLMSYSAKLVGFLLSTGDSIGINHINLLALIAEELVVAVGYFLEIEYKVLGEDLVDIWLIVLAFMAAGQYFNKSEVCPLILRTVKLGCQLVNLYRELRQVSDAVFALSTGLRNLSFCQSKHETKYSGIFSVSLLHTEVITKSAGLLLCSQKFRMTIHEALKTIPEGQASNCFNLLTNDISESLSWEQFGYSTAGDTDCQEGKCYRFSVHAELLGKVFSEMYSIVLDSIPLNAGNSNSIGVALKGLIMVLRPIMSSLVAPTQESAYSFVIHTIGMSSETNTRNYKKVLLNAIHWIFTFFFRLYISCRSLCEQVLSLMPPRSRLRISAIIGDGYTSYSGTDWMKSFDFTKEGYFSWIDQSSTSLPASIQFIRWNLGTAHSAAYSPMFYVLHYMVVQRLVGLNKQIRSMEYLLQNGGLYLGRMTAGDGLALLDKSGRRWEGILPELKEEAASLTAFMMKSLLLVDQEKLHVARCGEENSNDSSSQPFKEIYPWDMGMCSLNEKTLPTAIWWIICQNIDVWCSHATKKKLKLFFSILILSSLPYRSPSQEAAEGCTIDSGDVMKVTVQLISLDLLQDISFYELSCVRRYLAPSIFCALKKIISPSSSDLKDIDAKFNSLPDWEEVLSTLENPHMAAENELLKCDCCLREEVLPFLDDKITEECRRSSLQFTACQALLDFLFHMPKRSLNIKSFSCYIRLLLNLERLVVWSFMETHKDLQLHGQCQLLSLLLSCRMALKCFIMAFSEDQNEANGRLGIPILCDSSFPLLWLLKSVTVVAGGVNSCSNNSDLQANNMIFSLMDHTAYVFLTLSKYYFTCSFRFLMNTEKTCEELLDSSLDCKVHSSGVDACRRVNMMGELLRDQTMGFLMLNETSKSASKEDGFKFVNMSKVSSLLSCIQGFFCGLVATLEGTDARNSSLSVKFSSQCESISGIYHCIKIASKFMDSFLQKFEIDDDQMIGSICNAQELLELDGDKIFLEPSKWNSCYEGNNSDRGMQHLNPEMVKICPPLSDIDNTERERSALDEAVCVFSVMTEVDSSTEEGFRKILMQGFSNDENLHKAFFLREIFIASSAILRLCTQIKCSSLSPRLMKFLSRVSQDILLKFGNMAELPKRICFVWLDGALQFIEVLGCQLASSNPTMTRDVFARLVSLHLRAIGKCISLQQKAAKLASHQRESSTNTVAGHLEWLGSSNSDAMYILEELKARLRMSFKMLIKDSLELHLLSAIQVLERAVIGLQEGSTMIYEVNISKDDGGMVTSAVAAGIDCLDLILECVKGHRRMGVVKRHIQSLTASLFSIVLHLQGRSIFYRNLSHGEANINPDPGSVVLMCVEVLTIISRKDALFQMDSSHVVQTLRLPAALFCNFCHIKVRNQSPASNNLMVAAANDNDDNVVDRQFSIDLYAACCRLLYTAVKHHSSECVTCIYQLQYSIDGLLNCLVMVGTNSMDRNGYFTWTLEEGMKCASYLRRVYEEIRQHKVFEEQCFKFLSNYIRVFSGFGPLRQGLKREIDEAMRPGVHALIDVCSDEKLQHLHTVLEEGPCRSTLASLRRDYKLNFQYHGKV